jgi:hypothetical protein
MTDMLFEVEIKAVAEVRDADGNLVSSSPVTITTLVDETTLTQLDLNTLDSNSNTQSDTTQGQPDLSGTTLNSTEE